MATTESIEGIIGTLWYHYDVPGDVLYIRRTVTLNTDTYGVQNDHGPIVLRTSTY